MTDLHIASLDLNLLRVFDALVEEGSVTRAGARLGLSQSAVSHALNRLRHRLGDDLFVRTAHGMTPTPRARELGPRVHAGLSQLHAALLPTVFDPATSNRRFVLVGGAYACVVILPELVRRVGELAPQVELAVIEFAPDLMEQLESRRADFIFASVEATSPRLMQEVVLRESLAWVVRTGHPLAEGEVTLERLAATPHIGIARSARDLAHGLALRNSWEDAGSLEAELQRRGLTRRIGVTVPDAYTALGVIRRSDMAAQLPRRLAQTPAQTGWFQLIEPPYEPPVVDLSIVYLRERAAEPALAWMRDQIMAAAAAFR